MSTICAQLPSGIRPTGIVLTSACISARMSLVPMVQGAAVRASDVAALIAVKDNDFGGYTGPIAGLLVIGVIIALLTPAVKD